MAAIRRHWRAVLLNLLIVALATGSLAYFLASRPVTAESTAADGGGSLGGSDAAAAAPRMIDPVTYSQVQQLREQLCLSNHDLAAMGCTQASAEQVLSSILAWYEQNKVVLEQNDQAMLVAQSDAREAVRLMNIGPANAQHGRQYRQACDAAGTALQQRKQLLDAAIAALTPGLNGEQQAIWQAALANRSHDRYRYVPNLTAQQVLLLEQIDRDRNRTATSAESARNSALSIQQRQAISVVFANENARSGEVRAAEENVLPKPILPELGTSPFSE